MKLKIIGNRSGFTLVELMVSTGLFGYCALMMGTLFAEGSRLVVSVRSQADFNSQILLFNDVVDSYITNTTRIRSCICGTPGTCLYDGATGVTTLPTDGTRVPASCGAYTAANPRTDNACDFLDFDSDVANDPSQDPTGSCFGYSGWDEFTGAKASAQASSNPAIDADYYLYPKGCKERMKLRFIPPMMNSGAGTSVVAGTPGEIQILKISVGGTESILSKITGVYAFRCGFEAQENNSSGGAPTSFRIDIEAKTKKSPASRGDIGMMESWAPQDGIQFTKGLHKILSINIQYRNLSSESVQFGRTQSFRGCSPDFTIAVAGSTAESANCCSGYFDRALNQCIPQTACLPAGSPAVAGPTGDWEKCCSHKAYTIDGTDQCV